MNINTTAVVVVAFLMASIYFTSYMVYGSSSDWDKFTELEESSMSESSFQRLSNQTSVMTFESWIDNIYALARADITKSHATKTMFSAYIAGAFKSEKSWIINTYNIIKLDYHWGAGDTLFEKYNTGYNWWQNSPYLDEQTILWLVPISNYRYDIETTWYTEYINSHERGEEVKGFIEGNPVTEVISSWVGKATKGATVAWSMLSLNLIPDGEKNMPSLLKTAFLIFLIPLWIILLIGIAPLLLRVGELLIKGLDVIIPDWL